MAFGLSGGKLGVVADRFAEHVGEVEPGLDAADEPGIFEAAFGYKDIERVVEVVARAGLARRVARLVPIGVVKG